MDETQHEGQTRDRADAPAPGRLNPKSPREAITPEPAPPPPPVRSKTVRNPVVVALNALLTILVLAALAVGGVLYWGKSEFDAAGPLQAEKAVLVPSGSGLQAIADTLEREGVIADRYVFMGGISAYRQTAKLKAGEYAFEPGISMRGVMDLLVSGKSILHQVTVPEGLTSRQIVQRLMDHPMLTGEVDAIPPEGSLLPETYKFSRGTTRKQILTQMQAAHDKAVQEVWAGRRAGIAVATPDELVTLASIVEKETGKADERPRVAAVFQNRLRANMRLQSDPTIIYGIVGGEGTLGRSIRRSDIEARTAYNTYQINGLPPGPIANPGRAALEAVAAPAVTKDLYFVADGTGGHVFATSLTEHNRNVAAWRQVEKQRAAAVDQREPDAEGDDEAPAAAPAAGGDPLDLLEGAARKDPDAAALPTPKPAP